jgi:peptidoglycan/xylan/chitin deacetylase (PgdA/CDA1 family)
MLVFVANSSPSQTTRASMDFPNRNRRSTRAGYMPGGDALLLAYHAVSDDWPAPLAVTVDALRSQLAYLVARGYRGATFTEAVQCRSSSRLLVVTFDDAFRSILDVAFPILTDLGLPGTVFVPTDFVGSARPMCWPGIDQWLGGPHEAELRCLSWPELSWLAEAGWEIGSHTCSHPQLTRVGDQRLRDELVRSRLACEQHLGRSCRSLAYPYGDLDDRVVAAARAAGYHAACTLPDRPEPPEPLRYARVGIYRADTTARFRLKCSRVARRLWGVEALEPLVRRLRLG